MTANRIGYRGYIASRPVRGVPTPQHVQNLVIRDYAARRNLKYLLSATELNVPNSYMVLQDVLAEMPTIQGAIFYSLFMLPADDRQRHDVYDRILGNGGELHAALENLTISDRTDIRRIEDIWLVDRLLPACADPKSLVTGPAP